MHTISEIFFRDFQKIYCIFAREYDNGAIKEFFIVCDYIIIFFRQTEVVSKSWFKNMFFLVGWNINEERNNVVIRHQFYRLPLGIFDVADADAGGKSFGQYATVPQA